MRVKLTRLAPIPEPFAIGAPEVRLVDRLEAPVAPQLRRDRLARYRVFHRLPAPPAFFLQSRPEVLPEVLEGFPFLKGLFHRAFDIGKNIDLHRFRYGKSRSMLFVPDVAVAEGGF